MDDKTNEKNGSKKTKSDDFINDEIRKMMQARSKALEELLKKETRSKAIMSSMTTTLLIGIVASLLFSTVLSSEKNGSTVSKQAIKGNIISAINNGSDLRSIKQIYKNRLIEKKKILELFRDESGYYQSDTPLATILEDIRADSFLSEKKSSDFIVKLDEVIKAYYATNPFDKLDFNQKDYFENIRIKLGNNYDLIQNDLHKISDELFNKNSLVSKYLKDSTFSFWVSITALIFSFVISFVQLYQGRKSVLETMIFSAVLAATKGSNGKSDDDFEEIK